MGDCEILLELRHVAKRYPLPGGGEGPPILVDVSLEVRRGESVAVVGPSGSGKSTLLNIIGALDRPLSGQVLLDGRDLATLQDRELAHLRSRRIGFVFQLHHLLPQLTALENVLVPTLAGGPRPGRRPCQGGAGGPEDDAEARARGLLERVGLGGHLAHRPGQLSGGERQRVAVARALVNRPDLVLADEPTGSLDREASDNLAELLVDLNRRDGVTLVVVTHATHLAERMGRVLELRGGSLSPMRT